MLFLGGIAVVAGGDLDQRDVQGDTAGLDASGEAEEVTDLGFIAERADARRQSVLGIRLQPHQVAERGQLRVVSQTPGMEQVTQQVFTPQGGDLGLVVTGGSRN